MSIGSWKLKGLEKCPAGVGPGDELPVSLGFIILKARAAGLEKEAWNMGRRGWRMSGGGGRGCSGEIQYYKGGGSHTLGDLIDNYIILLVALSVMETYPTTALGAGHLISQCPSLRSCPYLQVALENPTPTFYFPAPHRM